MISGPRIILTVIVVFSCITAMAQNELRRKLDSIAFSGLEEGIPGIQVLISNNTGSTSIFNYGFQNNSNTNEVNDSTNWRYGSVTKIFTAAIILQLESEEKLHIDDPVSEYVNLKRHNDAGITIKHLLNHSSGLYNYTKANRMRHEDSMTECLEHSLKRNLRFTPGTKYQYCNTGYLILGMIVEKVTGQSFQQNITERIFEPCQLESMVYCTDEKVPSNTARGYERKRKKYKDVTIIDHKWANSAGAVLGNLSDLKQFVNCLFQGDLIDSTQLIKMITPSNIFRDIDAGGLEWYDHGVGLSWFLNLDREEKAIYISHGGNTRGYNVDIHHNTRNNMTIVIGMNLFPNGKYEPVFSTQNRIINAIHEFYTRKE